MLRPNEAAFLRLCIPLVFVLVFIMLLGSL